MLICPKCKQPLVLNNHTYQCDHHHSFDVARRGYVNLLLGSHGGSGDDKDMIRSRTQFLSKGYYQPLCDELCEILKKTQPTLLIDAGCGEGFYTNQIKATIPTCELYGFDLSKHGIDEACKAHLGVVYAVANVFHLPMQKACADALLSVFAPYDLDEVERVLKKEGVFIKVGPGQRHLMGLKQVVYENVYENECTVLNDERFQLVDIKEIEYHIHLKEQVDIKALFQMTPYYWKSPKQGSERLLARDELTTIVHFRMEMYRKK